MKKTIDYIISNHNVLTTIVIQFLILFICLTISISCNLSFYSGILYFVFQLTCIALPGLAFFLLLKIKRTNLTEYILYSYTLGLAIILIEYYLLAFLKISTYSPILAFLVCLFSIYLIYRNRVELQNMRTDRNIIWLLMVFVFLSAVCFFAIAYCNVSPEIYGGTIYKKDFLFWVGNCLSFTKGLPVQDYRLVGESFYYHYFSSIIITQSSFICGVDIITLCFYYSYIIPCLLLTLSCYVFLKSLVKDNLLIFLGFFIILMSDGMTSGLPDILYFCPFGFDYAYALSMLAFADLVYLYQNNRFTINEIFLSCLLIVLTTGFKGPNALVVLMAFGVVTLSFLLKKEIKKGLILGTVWLTSFVITYCTFLANIFATGERTNDLVYVGLLGSFDTNSFAIKILNKLIWSYSFPDNGLTRIISLGLYIFLNNTGAMLLLFLGLISIFYFIKRKEDLTLEAAVLLVSVWGIALTNLTHQDGNSQRYFILSCLPFCTLSGLYPMDHFIKNKKRLYLATIFVLIVSLLDILRFINDSAYNSINNSFQIRNGDIVAVDQRYYFSDQEYQAAKWLKQNTDENDYIAIDCFEYDGMRKEVMMGVFSERFIWDDGQYSNEKERDRRRSIAQKAVKGDSNAIQDLQQENVKYLIQTLSQNPDIKIDKDRVVFKNKVYVIFEIQ